MTTLSSLSGGGDPPGPLRYRLTSSFIATAPDPPFDPLPKTPGACRWLFEENEFVVTGITALLENKVPFLRRVKCAAGQLPIHQVHLFALVAIGLDTDIFGAAADAFDFLERRVQIVIVEVVQRRDRNDEIEML